MGKLIIKNEYGQTPNSLLNNKKISFKAKGLFGFIQSKGDGWNFSVERIAKQTKDGKDGISSAMKELEKYGYLSRKSSKNSKGVWNGYDYVLEDKPLTENPSTDKPLTENTITLSKKDNRKKKVVRKNKVLQTEVCDQKENNKKIGEIIDVFKKTVNPVINFGHKTHRTSIMEMTKIKNANGEDFTLNQVLELTKLAVSIQGKPFTPTITTPTQLKNKYGDLRIYFEKENNKNKGEMPIVL